MTDVTDRSFTLIDTGGIEPRTDDQILSFMRDQAQIAIENATVIIFLTDAVGLVRGQDIAEGSVEVDSSSFFAAEEKKTIKAIQTAAFTGNPGDGKIISYDLKSALRIRTGETDKDAIN